METTRTEIVKVGKNNVEKRVYLKLIDRTEIEDEKQREAFGTDRVDEQIIRCNEMKSNWQDEKWIANFVKERIDSLEDKITILNLIKTELEKE